MKRSKLALVAILLAIVVMAAPASAFIMSQDTETKAERMVDIAYGAQETIMGIVTRVENNATAYDLLLASDLDELFYGNVSLCVADQTVINGTAVNADGEGWALLVAADASLSAGEYEDSIEGARDALEIFRDVLRSINGILVDAGIESSQILDSQLLQEAIDRSRDRIEQLQDLLADEVLLGNLTDVQDFLDQAQTALDSGELEDAKDALMEANSIISYVCQQLRIIAQGLNPGRITSYFAHARQYKEKFQERFGNAWNEDIDVNALLQRLGYEDEEDFMQQLQQMLDNAQGKQDIKDVIKDLKDLGQMIKKMDSALTQEFGNHGNGNGQGQSLPGNGKGTGNMGGGNGS